MGMAYNAPAPHYQRRHVISGHALQRFRERADKEFTSRPDSDLGNLLDERVTVSTTREKVTDLISGGVESELVRIDNRDGRWCYAVVRDLTVVTVLTREQAENNFQTGAWKRDPINSALRDKLKNVTAVNTVDTRPASAQKLAAIGLKPCEPPAVPEDGRRPDDLHARLAEIGAEYANAVLGLRDAQVATVNASTVLRECESNESAARKRVEDVQQRMNDTIDQVRRTK